MKNDARSLSHATLEELRIRTVRQVQAGQSPEKLYKVLGIARSTIYNWISTFVSGGESALKAKPIPGRPSLLSEKQLAWLAKVLIDKTPEQFKLEFALWTRDGIREVIKRKCGIKISKTGISRILDKLGYSFQRPAVRFAQQDPIIVKKWLEEDYARIKAEAKEKGAEIYFGDEANVSSMNYKLAKTVGKKGKTPVVKRTAKRFKVNMISAVSPQGEWLLKKQPLMLRSLLSF
jgi:transposase